MRTKSPLRRGGPWLPLSLLFSSALIGCRRGAVSDDASASPVGQVTASASASASASVSAARRRPARLTGSALARGVDGSTLYLADEDGGELRRFKLPLQPDDLGQGHRLAGPPAQVIATDGLVFVTQRDPARVVVLADDGASWPPREVASIVVPDDAWGMALSPDGATLAVTSAWAHVVSLVDVAHREVVARIDVAREPRGVIFAPDGKHAWVTHLVGTAVTRIDVDGSASKATPIALPAAPMRAPRGGQPGASLAYAVALSDDGTRLLVPRHALGAVTPRKGENGWSSRAAWWGTPTVDVLLLRDEAPLAPSRSFAPPTCAHERAACEFVSTHEGLAPDAPIDTFTQPRDALPRRSHGTLLVVSEGTDAIAELEPLALDPGLQAVRSHPIGDGYKGPPGKAKSPAADRGSAPQAIALVDDESAAIVWGRGSRDLTLVSLTPGPPSNPLAAVSMRVGPLPEPMSADAAVGRKLFLFGKNDQMSEGLACAGCHPEGRDDGFVWHEALARPKRSQAFASAPTTASGAASSPAASSPAASSVAAAPAAAPDATRPLGVFVGHPSALFEPIDDGLARQTPMLAGRVASRGPYGWHGQNKTLADRLVEGFKLHRWSPAEPTEYGKAVRVRYLEAFVRNGLRPPPKDTSPFTPQQERGRAIFESSRAACATCHPPASEYTTRAPGPLRPPLATRPGFAPDPDNVFRVPSLLFVGATPPYYHDGSVATLTELIEKNGTRMGDTSHLSADERAALVAFLQRL